MRRNRPLFIDAGNRRLYAVYYPAAGEPRRRNVVYCPPFGQEHVRLYRALHESALRMSRSGFDVLRFEFSGTGNSLDPDDAICIDMWHEDLIAAVNKVIELSTFSTTSMFAIRMGTVVALHHSNHQPAFRQLALFDPILSGADYVAELDTLHTNMCEQSNKFLHPSGKLALTDSELAGHSVTPELLGDLASWQLEQVISEAPCPVHVVFSQPNVFSDARSIFDKTGGDVCLEPYACNWRDAGALEAIINPKRCLEHLEEKLVLN